MALNIRNGQNYVTGRESWWGDMKPSPGMIDLINKSPTLQSELHDYGAQVSAGQAMPMQYGNKDGTYFDGSRIVIGTDYQGLSDDTLTGALSHEIGHFENKDNDQKFAEKYKVNPRDPNAYNVSAMRGAHGEGEAMYNNWQVQQEIRNNKAAPDKPGTEIYFAAPENTQQQFDQKHQADVKAGKSAEEDRNLLIPIGMNATVNDVPSTAPNKTYYQYYGEVSGAAAPESGGPPKVKFDGDEKGNVNSMTEHWPSGDVGTQTFVDGKIQNAQMVDGQGAPISSATYQHNADGGYSVDVVSGNGHETEHDEFNPDNSGITRQYNEDNSQKATSFDSKNRNTQMVDYDAKGQYINGDYFDPASGQIRSHSEITQDGGHSLTNYDSSGRPRESYIYAANGNFVQHDYFDENGRNTRDIRYDPTGARMETTFNDDGTQSSQFFGSNGGPVPNGGAQSQAAGNPAPAEGGQQASGAQQDGTQENAGNGAMPGSGAGSGSPQQVMEPASAIGAGQSAGNPPRAAAPDRPAASTAADDGSRQDVAGTSGISGADAGDQSVQTSSDTSGADSSRSSMDEDNAREDAAGAGGADAGGSSTQTANATSGDDGQRSQNATSDDDGQSGASDA
ncbi:hypothetical protein [Paraburkholderia sp. J63]|uniref:hypothetical protein n=1 Tax=Paraburkholderia sp. J63 TaxID=2805434 RepID=UPI002ABE1D7F|nr:hypothetical protein [Paraburkholderia sp. J63]